MNTKTKSPPNPTPSLSEVTDWPSVLSNIKADKVTIDDLIRLVDQLQTRAEHDKVGQLYEQWIEQSASPYKFVACFNYGVLLAAQGKNDAAADSYRRAITLNPGFSQPRINLGLTLERLGKNEDAIAQWQVVVEDPLVRKSAPTDILTTALNHLGRLKEMLRDYGPAEEALKASLEINPNQDDTLHHWVHLRQNQCKWPVLEEFNCISKNKMLRAMSPLAMLAHADDPALQLLAADNFVKRKFNFELKNLAEGRKYQHTRIRVGYLSGDLCTHAVGLLLPELFEHHDRSQFEIFAYDYSPEDGTEVRQRFKRAIEHFSPIHHLSDEQAAQQILKDEIDILVDLHGLSLGVRAGILAQRPSPVQVTYLGYIGTTAMPWIDYAIADRHSIPEEIKDLFSEKIIYLDCACLPGDTKRHVTPVNTRAEVGLPEGVFVFASFNNSYKLNPTMFNCWMQILKQVEGSVLWMVDDNSWATKNLQDTAKSFGIESSRLIFSKRVSMAEYLGRMHLADLFLDNHPYNAGSTASDVLWMGLPMITLSGRTFVSRMAGSKLVQLGLPELVNYTLADYLSLAVRLAKDSYALRKIREKLTVERHSENSKDMKFFTLNVESKYVAISDKN